MKQFELKEMRAMNAAKALAPLRVIALAILISPIASAAITPPNEISGLEAWYQADNIVNGAEPTGGTIQSWYDSSGNGHNLSSAGGTSGPTFLSDGGTGFGNRPVVGFDGSDDELFTSSALTGQTIIVLADFSDVQAGEALFSARDDYLLDLYCEGTNVWSTGMSGTTTVYQDSAIPLTTTTGFPDAFAMDVSSGPHVVALAFAGSATEAFQLGQAETSGFGYAQGSIAEVIIYNRQLSVQEINMVGYYLEDKYSLSNASFTPPFIIDSLTPADDAVNVAPDTNLIANFTETVKAGTGNIVLKKISDNSTVQTFDVTSGVTFSGTQVIINPASALEPVNNSEPGVGYYLLIDSGAILSAATNEPFFGIADPETWNFYTRGSPIISSLYPADGATGAVTSVVATFDKPVTAGVGFVRIKNASDDSTVQSFNVSSEVTFDGNTLTVNPSQLNGDTAYYVTIDSSAVVDALGNPFAGISDKTTWNFTAARTTVAYWQFDSSSTSPGLSDSVGNHHFTASGTFNSSTTTATNPVPNPDTSFVFTGDSSANPDTGLTYGALLCNGGNVQDRLTAQNTGDVFDLDGKSFTFEGWFTHDTTPAPAGFGDMIGGTRINNPWRGYVLRMIGGGEISFYVTDGTNSWGPVTEAGYNDGEFHHFAVVWQDGAGEHSNGLAQIYIDGVLKAEASAPAAFNAATADSANDFAIGGRAVNDCTWDGLFDEFRFSNAALTPSQFLNAAGNLNTYNLTYYGNGSDGGSVPVDAGSPYPSGATVTVQDNTGGLTKTGATFAGWNTQSDGSGTAYTAGNSFSISEDLILYAQWTPTQTSAYADYATQNGGSTTDPTADDNNNGVQDGVEYAFYEALGTGVKLESPGQLGQILWGTLDAMGTPNNPSDDHLKYAVLLPASPPADVTYRVYASSVAPGDSGKTLLATCSSGSWTLETGVTRETGPNSEDVIVDTQTPSTSARRFVWLELEITGLE